MTGLINRHDMSAGPGLLPLLDQIGERLIDQSLKLPPFALRKVTHLSQDFRIYLGCELLTGARLRTSARISESTWVANFSRPWDAIAPPLLLDVSLS
jgi:hypothetical protein